MRRIMCLALVSLAVGLWLLPANGFAVTQDFMGFEIAFHGHLENRTIARNQDGFQYRLFDGDSWVPTQEMIEAQADFTVRPKSPWQPICGINFEKAFFRYRAHYDAIFDLTDDWEPIPGEAQGVSGPNGHPHTNKFDFGEDDIKWENDMREMFVDLSAQPFGSTSNLNIRVGRQIVQWGEADGFNVLNHVNPNDNRWMMFFSMPEDMLLPIYMLRTDLTLPGAGWFDAFKAQFLIIPDNRPNLLAPSCDGNYKAPYAFLFPELGFAAGGMYPEPMTNGIGQFTRLLGPFDSGVPMYDNSEQSTLDNMQFGVRLGTEVKGWQLNAYYLYSRQHNPAINISYTAANAAPVFMGYEPAGPLYAELDHPRINMFGLSFNKFIEYGGFVLRGEVAYTDGGTQFNLNNVVDDFISSGFTAFGTGYEEHDVWEAVLGFDKQWSNIHLWTDSALITNFQIFFRHINNWNEDMHQVLFDLTEASNYLPVPPFPGIDYGTSATQDRLRFTLLAMTDYVHGTVKPQIFVAYEPTGQWMTNASVEWCPDGHWYASLTQMSFWGSTSYTFDPLTDFQPFIKSASEVGLKLGFRW
ncbi:MAG: DUF1302 family protein [Syntrophobacteraceae bacterium]